MKKRNVILATLIVVVTLVAVPLVLAGPHGGRGHHGGGDPLGMLLRAKEELNLSDAQVDQIKTIFKSLHEQNAANREQLRGGHEEIISTLLANPGNVAAAQRILDEQLAAEKTLKSNMLQAASKALGVLTPEQRTKLAEHIGEMRERHDAMRSQRFGGGPRPDGRQ
ncbi:MAG TPA: Spy/CpxP family protein refolding chaperone [Thermoanaerobaculia bacterium]